MPSFEQRVRAIWVAALLLSCIASMAFADEVMRPGADRRATLEKLSARVAALAMLASTRVDPRPFVEAADLAVSRTSLMSLRPRIVAATPLTADLKAEVVSYLRHYYGTPAEADQPNYGDVLAKDWPARGGAVARVEWDLEGPEAGAIIPSIAVVSAAEDILFDSFLANVIDESDTGPRIPISAQTIDPTDSGTRTGWERIYNVLGGYVDLNCQVSASLEVALE